MMAKINEARVAQVAEFLKANPPKNAGMNFYSVQTPKGELVLDTMYPSLHHPQAVDFFFFACLHQYGFWYGDDKGYVKPMVGNIGEKKLKGSDLLWTLLKRKLNTDPSFFSPKRLATVPLEELADVLTDDVGTQWPDFEKRFAITREYGRWLMFVMHTPTDVLTDANDGPLPLKRFLHILRCGPFGGDRLQKKQLLLAMTLVNRPEHFLRVDAGAKWFPIVDYHLMRTALRLGLVDLDKGFGEYAHNAERKWVLNSAEESHIRSLVHDAIAALISASGLSMAAIDEMLWMARKYCPEMTEPECNKCLFSSVCAKRTELFQPVFRTTAY